MTDHANRVLYSNQSIAYASYFSVSLFVLISGITSWISLDKTPREVVGGGIRHFSLRDMQRLRRIIFPYMIAVAVAVIRRYRFFEFQKYLYHLIHFDGLAPHYYMSLYIQLLLIRRLIFTVLKQTNERDSRKKLFREGFYFIIIVMIAFLTTRYTDIFSIYGGGGKLFGGTYLILFFIGMLLQSHGVFDKYSKKKSTIVFIVSFSAWICWWRFQCNYQLLADTYFPFGGGFNPPSFTFMLSGILMLFVCYGFFTILQATLPHLTQLVAFIGQHTLYIFLYHMIFRDIVYYLMKDSNIWLKRIICYIAMIVGPIIIQALFSYMKGMYQSWVYRVRVIHNSVDQMKGITGE